MEQVTIVWLQGASVKNGPNTGGSALYVYPAGSTFKASAIIHDNVYPTDNDKLWAVIAEGSWIGKYVAVRYPSSSGNPVRATWQTITDTPPVDPPPAEDYFILESPTGVRTKYVRVSQ